MTLSRLALGAAQFGLDYGIVNRVGQITRENAAAILSIARASGLDTIDTAIAYGSSEARLGELGVKDFMLISKLPAVPKYVSNVSNWIELQALGSLHRLQVSNLYGLLLNRSTQWNGNVGRSLRKNLHKFKEKGLVRKIGISIYSPDELDDLDALDEVDLVQAPFNLLDRRLHASGWLERLHERGIELHVRSVFLQGLLLTPRARIPEKFSPWSPLWQSWQDWQMEHPEVSPACACMGFVQSFQEISRIVIGVDSPAQLHELINAASTPLPEAWPEIATPDERLIHPYNWNAL